MSGDLVAFLAAFGGVVLVLVGNGLVGVRRRRGQIVKERAAVEDLLDERAGQIVALDGLLPPPGKASRYVWDDALRAYDAARDASAGANDMLAFADAREIIAPGSGGCRSRGAPGHLNSVSKRQMWEKKHPSLDRRPVALHCRT